MKRLFFLVAALSAASIALARGQAPVTGVHAGNAAVSPTPRPVATGESPRARKARLLNTLDAGGTLSLPDLNYLTAAVASHPISLNEKQLGELLLQVSSARREITKADLEVFHSAAQQLNDICASSRLSFNALAAAYNRVYSSKVDEDTKWSILGALFMYRNFVEGRLQTTEQWQRKNGRLAAVPRALLCPDPNAAPPYPAELPPVDQLQPAGAEPKALTAEEKETPPVWKQVPDAQVVDPSEPLPAGVPPAVLDPSGK